MRKEFISIFLCTLLLSFVFSAIGGNSNKNDDALILIRVNKDIYNFLVTNNFEIVGSKPGQSFDVIITIDRLKDLDDAEIDYEIIIPDVEEYDNLIRGSYHTLAQIEDMLNDIANNYPDITNLYSIGTTYEGRDIWCLEISDNPGVDEGEPGVFFMGLHHAREWPTVEICLNIANELTSNYDSDPEITDVVDNVRLWLVTCVNPDGYYYCHDLGNDWRKNRQPYPGGIGVDLNRNYGGSSNGNPWGSWGSTFQGATGHSPSDEVYCGPMPFSEYEIQAVRNILLNNEINALISWHTYSELVLWPWGYTPTHAPDYTYLSQIGQQIALLITSQSGSGTYTPQQACTLYPTTGDLIDWSYGYGQYVQGRPTFAYTIEACSTFHPSASYLDQICIENFDGALYLLQEVDNIRDTVIPRVIPPVIDELPIDTDGNYTISWQEKNPQANPQYFQLDELMGLNLHIDDVESGSNLWNLDGFTLSTARSHSISHSYKSRYSNDDVSSMTTVTPLLVTEGMKLSFWCWYNTENGYDYTFLEVSKDGRYFDVLDKYTGSSGNWIFKEYNLDNYNNESIFIRLRYETDGNTLQEGFYLDDISPIPEFTSINTLSNSINENYYDITGKTNGEYYYRVKGYNSQQNWGDFSTLKKVVVSIIPNQPPNTPNISGTENGKLNVEYNYNIITTDPDGNDLYYYVDWGDENNTGWLGPYLTGEEISVSHNWLEKGTYIIKVKAKDIYGEESDWSTLEVTMPRNRLLLNSLLKQLLNRFQEIFLILKFIRG